MTRFALNLAVLFLVIPVVSQGSEIEAKDMSRILDFIDSDTIFITDLDNTMVKPIQTLGSDQWFTYLKNQFQASGLDEKAAVDKAIPIWESIQKVMKVKTVERNTPNIIRELQARGIKMMALTARPPDLADATRNQLLSVEIDLDKTPIHSDVILKEHTGAELHNGVLFIGPGENKGLALVHFLKQIKLTPKRVVYIDDKKEHVDHVEEAMNTWNSTLSQNSQIEHISLRYAAADEEVKNFNPAIAERQLKEFTDTGALISDKQAACQNGLDIVLSR